MTDDEIVIKISKAVHPQLYLTIEQSMADFNCKTYPELLKLMFDRASLRRRIKKDFMETLLELGLIQEEVNLR